MLLGHGPRLFRLQERVTKEIDHEINYVVALEGFPAQALFLLINQPWTYTVYSVAEDRRGFDNLM